MWRCFILIATTERVEILDEARNLSLMILQSELAEEYRSCLYTLQKDREAQKLIAEFQVMKEKYEEVQRFGRYHPDFRTVSKETRELKRKLDLHETIADFKKAEDNLQGVLDEISVILGGAVSKHIKVPTGNPYFDSMSSCGGGCGSGGACGCK